jgi:2-oxoglutarate dehydrogenase E1 component
MKIALEYRQTFHRDVFIDLLGYRKYGHNEGDEPKFTQPQLYKAIAAHPSPRETYLAKLLQDGTVTAEEAEALKASLVQAMEDGFEEAKSMELSVVDDFLSDLWEALPPGKRPRADQFSQDRGAQQEAGGPGGAHEHPS